MSRSMLRKTLAGLAGIFLLATCFQVRPISILLGQNDKAMDGQTRLNLQPGECYLVYSDKPVTLPHGVHSMSAERLMGTSFSHDGVDKDTQKHCAGQIKMALLDNGHLKYQCVLCNRVWIRDAEGKLVENCKEK